MLHSTSVPSPSAVASSISSPTPAALAYRPRTRRGRANRDAGKGNANGSSDSFSASSKSSTSSSKPSKQNQQHKPPYAPDIPPALRHLQALVSQQSEVSSLRNTDFQPAPIYAGLKLREVLPVLCANGELEAVASNIVYRALEVFTNGGFDDNGIMDRKAAFVADFAKKRIFETEIYTVCSLLFETHCVQDNAEAVFAVGHTGSG